MMRIIFGMALASLVAVPVHAETLQGVIVGTIGGDDVRIEYELDASAADLQPGDSNTGVYFLDPITVEIGGVAQTVTARSLNVFVSTDIVSVGIAVDGLCNDGQPNLAVVLQGTTIITSDALPTAFTDGDFSNIQFFLKEAGTCTQVGGSLTSWEHGPLTDPTVPTVSQWGLISLALLIVCAGTLVQRRNRDAGTAIT